MVCQPCVIFLIAHLYSQEHTGDTSGLVNARCRGSLSGADVQLSRQEGPPQEHVCVENEDIFLRHLRATMLRA